MELVVGYNEDIMRIWCLIISLNYNDLSVTSLEWWWMYRGIIPKWLNYSGQWVIVVHPDTIFIYFGEMNEMNRTSINPIFFGVKTGVHLKIPAFCNHYHNILEQRRNWFSIPNYTSPIVQLIWMSIPYATRSNGCAAIQELHPNMHGKPVVADTENTLKGSGQGHSNAAPN